MIDKIHVPRKHIVECQNPNLFVKIQIQAHTNKEKGKLSFKISFHQIILMSLMMKTLRICKAVVAVFFSVRSALQKTQEIAVAHATQLSSQESEAAQDSSSSSKAEKSQS